MAAKSKASQASMDSEFQKHADRELKRRKAELEQLDAELAELQARRNRVAETVAHLQGLQGLLDLDSTGRSASYTGRVPTPSPVSRRRADADLVVEYLQETGKPAHYREIYQALAKRGLAVKGKDPANTLLARYFNDPRLQRVARGTYSLKT